LEKAKSNIVTSISTYDNNFPNTSGQYGYYNNLPNGQYVNSTSDLNDMAEKINKLEKNY